MKRGFAALLGLVALGLIGSAAWRLQQLPPAPAPAPAAQATPAPAPPPAEVLAVMAPVGVASAGLKAGARPAPGPRRSTAASGAVGAASWDLCGLGRVPVPAGTEALPSGFQPELPAPLGELATAAALDRLLAALEAGPPRWRAAAELLRGPVAPGPVQAAALSKLAAATSDPVVSLWALQRCEPGTCRLADGLRWTQQEPGNLASWLALLSLQPERRPELLVRMTQAERFDLHYSALMDTARAAMPQDVPPYVQINLWFRVIGVEAFLGIGSLQPLLAACRPAPPPGSDLQSQCAQVARTLIDHSDTMLGPLIGLRIAELVGMPKAEAEARRKALHALTIPQGLFDSADFYSCKAHARTSQWLAMRSALGEVETLKRWPVEHPELAASAPR